MTTPTSLSAAPTDSGSEPDAAATTRTARCCCGQLRADCTGEPARVSMCHCLSCQQRTGSVFGVQARYHQSQVTLSGEATIYERTGDSGSKATLHFCPRCGTTLYWLLDGLPDAIAIAVGAFCDPQFTAPTVSVYGARRHPWAKMPDLRVEEWD